VQQVPRPTPPLPADQAALQRTSSFSTSSRPRGLTFNFVRCLPLSPRPLRLVARPKLGLNRDLGCLVSDVPIVRRPPPHQQKLSDAGQVVAGPRMRGHHIIGAPARTLACAVE